MSYKKGDPVYAKKRYNEYYVRYRAKLLAENNCIKCRCPKEDHRQHCTTCREKLKRYREDKQRLAESKKPKAPYKKHSCSWSETYPLPVREKKEPVIINPLDLIPQAIKILSNNQKNAGKIDQLRYLFGVRVHRNKSRKQKKL